MNCIDLRRGQVFDYEGEAYFVVENEHVTPGKGRAMCQVKMKSIRTGAVVQRRFRPQDKVELIFVEKKEMEYLYQDGTSYVFMDTETFDQTSLHADFLGDDARWLLPNTRVQVELYDGRIINVNLPDTMTFEVRETDPVVKGQTATNQYKPAILENGEKVMVPPFISVGEKIRVDIRDGKYLERAKS